MGKPELLDSKLLETSTASVRCVRHLKPLNETMTTNTSNASASTGVTGVHNPSRLAILLKDSIEVC